MIAPAIRMRAVERRVEAAGGGTHTLVGPIDLDVAQGAVLQLVGPSGAGKTTLLRLCNRLDEISAGSADVLGRPLPDWPPAELRRSVGMVFQEPLLVGGGVADTLALPARIAGTPAPEAEAAVEAAMQLAGVEPDWLDRDADQLSTGQKQRVCLARALVLRPRILLLDEPTAGLDARSSEVLLDRLAELNRANGTTLMLVTHRLDEAPRLGGELAVLVDGRLAARGPVAEILANPPAGPVRAFLHGERDGG